MNTKKVKLHLKAFDLAGKTPAALVILQELYGLSATDIATSINRSANQMTYYRNGKTPIPEKVNERLKNLLVEAAAIVDSHETETDEADDLMDAIARITRKAIEAM